MYNNVLENNENSRNFLSELNESCSFAMDDGGRCLLDVINDPLLLQSFLESGSDENSKDLQDGTSSESAVESPQVSRSSHASLSNHISSAEHIVEQTEQMGYSYAVDSQGLLAQSGVCPSSSGGGGMSLVVASSSVGPQTYQHASSSGATIHHIPSSVAHSSLHPHSPASARPATPLSHNIKSPGQGPSSVHSMPPPSPLQQTRSPLPSHTPSPAPAWSPAPPVLSPATSRAQSSMPSVAFQQSHNQILQTTCNVTQFVTALATQQSITQKLTLQQQQQLFLQQQLSPASQQQSAPRLTGVTSPVVTTAAVAVTPPMVQLISAPQSNVSLPTRTSHSTVRPIQPKLPPQILPKPATCSASSQFVTPAPAPKQTPPTPVTAGQRTVGVGIQPGATGQLVIGQGQPGVFSGPQGTIVLNQIIPGVGQSPILIQGNLSNLANIPGLQLTLRPPSSASPGQPMNSTTSQNNATLIAALQGPSQHAQTLFAQAKSPIHGQQTIVIPNNIAHAGITSQNINLTSTAIPNSNIMSSSSQGQGFLARSNIILSPRVVGGNQGLQLQQIQTPQGPILAFAPSQAIAVPHLQTALQNATLGNAQLAPVTVPMHGVMAAGQGVISGISLQSHAPQSALQQQTQQSLFSTAVPFTSHLEQSPHQVIQVPQPLAPHQVSVNHPNQLQSQQQQVEHSPKPASPPKPSKVPSVNLEELLKEHGIVPENSPPPSPDSNSPSMEDTVPSQLQPSSTVVPSPHLITALQSQQVLLEQLSQSPQGHASVPLKLAFTQDGSVIFQPHSSFGGTPRVHQYVSSGQVHGRATSSVGSVILPTVTTSSVSVPVVTTEPSTSRNHSALIARLNAGPAISVPEVSPIAVVSCAGGSTTTSITTTTITTTTTTLVPLTVQSLNVNSSPIASSYIVQKTNPLPTGTERVFVAEDVIPPQNNVTSVISSNPVQNIPNRINHVNSGFQALVVPNEHLARTSQNTPKTVQSSHMGNGSTTNSQNVVQPELEKSVPNDTHRESAEITGAPVPSHIHPAFSSNVPNQALVQKIHKEISELVTLKYRTQEQQRTLNHLLAFQQKYTGQNRSGKGCRANQNQVRAEEVDRLIQQRPQNNPTSVVNEPSPHLQLKTPVLATQQSVQHEKQQNVTNSKVVASHNVHLVNLLKKGPHHNAPVKHIAPATTSITAICDSTTTVPNVTVTTHQRVNQVITPNQQRLPTAHGQCNKQTNEVAQQQVIVRMPKPQQQTGQACPNIVQLKAPPPPPPPPPPPAVKRVVNTVPRTVLINEQLTKDQNGALNPDVKTPFSSIEDACRRLLPFHVYNSKVPSVVEIEKADETFNKVAVTLLDRFRRLKNKYHLLQIKESMLPCATPDQVLLERLFIEDEEAALREDKALIAEGKILDLPPPPQSWLKKLHSSCSSPSTSSNHQAVVKEEAETDSEENTEKESSDPHVPEDSDLLYKEDDNLEAPVIDSCADIMVPQNDYNCERSPPTLKRIVIKPEKLSERDLEEPLTRKRFKFNNMCVKPETVGCDWSHDGTHNKLVSSKHSDKDNDLKTNHKYLHAPLTRDSFHSDNRLDVDMMAKMLNISPMEIDDDIETVDFEPPSGTNDLADFEPPVARTEESCNSNLLYNSNIRTNCEVKYDFDMLGCPAWADDYVHHPPNESDVNADTIMSDHGNPSDLDLSGLDGLEDHLEGSQHGIPNGIQNDDDSAVSGMSYIGYRIPKHQKRYTDIAAQSASNCSNNEQVQSAIKSITGTHAENTRRSYFGADDVEFLHLNKQSHNAHITDYGGNIDAEMGVTRGESDEVLDEAVRSILL
ncbi:BRD4-interacting chromatin-remodeling complex-associated protein-like isoform X2 [Stegodyphus dumicola]|uniref:BRD4-interacting chromatin-remodeling complex-associated protein-like isoform X2 n=1 Tax=Stegodyphus dumicola TaxID=202533 RepID=UPI0015B19D45|nr:BRD4-interacting chromatin-remodeling complex-associated protein-like isoform X2 [Stegodyphus dumicola]